MISTDNMSLQTAPDIAVLITVPESEAPNARLLISAERRVTPAWTISQLKAKLESVTGIPPSSQVLRTRSSNGSWIDLNDETSQVGDRRYGLKAGSEIYCFDTRPAAARQNFTDASAVEKYEMPKEQYEKLDDSVLAWKRKQKLGRFDPNAKSKQELAVERRTKDQGEIERKKIQVGARCRVGGEDVRRGEVKFIGEIDGLGGEAEAGCLWVGVELDEPMGRNNGTCTVQIDGRSEVKQIFQCRDKHGVFARPEKVEVGHYPVLDDLMDDDMEEI